MQLVTLGEECGELEATNLQKFSACFDFKATVYMGTER